MNPENMDASKDLDKELSVLRELIEKENDMLRRMLSSLDALEKKMIRPGKKEGRMQKKA